MKRLTALCAFSIIGCGATGVQPQNIGDTVENVIRASLPLAIDLSDDTNSGRAAWLGVATGIETIILPSLQGEIPQANPVLEWIEFVKETDGSALIADGVQWGINLLYLIIGPDWLERLMDDSEVGAKVRQILIQGFTAMSDVIRAHIETGIPTAMMSVIPPDDPAIPVDLVWPYREVRLP